ESKTDTGAPTTGAPCKACGSQRTAFPPTWAGRRHQPLLYQDVVAWTAVEDILTRSPNQDVVAATAAEAVDALATDQHVIAVASVGRELDRAGGQLGGFHHVVAVQDIDDELVEVRLGTLDVDTGGQTVDIDAGRVAVHRDHIVAISAIDDDG